MTPSDKCILNYRERLAEWDAKGWRIDMDTVVANQKKVAYAVPSPARREVKGWVLDTVPLIDGGQVESRLKAAN